MKEPEKKQIDFNLPQKLFAGAIAGISGTLIIFPIDAIKTRLQSGIYSTEKKSISGLQCFGRVVRGEGVRGLYRGLSANLVGVTPEKAIKLAVNDAMRAHFANRLSTPVSHLPAIYGMMAGGIAGFCQVIATNPMEIVKIRMQLARTQGDLNANLISVVKKLGLRGCYRGTLSTLCRDIPFSMIFFQTFAHTKTLLIGDDEGGRMEEGERFMRVLLSGVVAGAISAYAATPMDVVKTRLQSQDNNTSRFSLPAIYKNIWKEEGIRGFFRGGVQRCLIISPLFAISLLVYELQQHYLATPKS